MRKLSFLRRVPMPWWVVSVILAAVAVMITVYVSMPEGAFAVGVRSFAQWNGSDTWDWLAFVVAVISFVFAAFTWSSQNKTEKNTMQIDDRSQQKILVELTCHLFRNLIVICAVEEKLNGRYDSHYPSEESLLKLKIDMDAMAFRKQADNFNVIHELQLLLRNFNSEIDVALVHFRSQQVFDYAKKRDFATLKFKMSHLTDRIVDCMKAIWHEDFSDEIADAIFEAAKKRNKNENRDEARSKMTSDFQYYNNTKSCYYSLFRNEERRKEFLSLLNIHIQIEKDGLNSQGYEKILIIPFDKTKS